MTQAVIRIAYFPEALRLTVGALAALGNLPLGGVRKAQAGPPPLRVLTTNPDPRKLCMSLRRLAIGPLQRRRPHRQSMRLSAWLSPHSAYQPHQAEPKLGGPKSSLQLV
jgi:hypothetical protein